MGKKKSGFLKEFKEFAMKGNMLDLAVGVIVGGAFKTVVDALTNSVIMPVVSMFLGGLSFEEWKIRLCFYAFSRLRSRPTPHRDLNLR